MSGAVPLSSEKAGDKDVGDHFLHDTRPRYVRRSLAMALELVDFPRFHSMTRCASTFPGMLNDQRNDF
jgi:hypothetical protein